MTPELAAELLAIARDHAHGEPRSGNLREALGRATPSIARIVRQTLAPGRAKLAKVNLDVEDGVQEVLLKMASESLPSTPDARDPERVVAHWVRTVATRWFLSAVRREKWVGELPRGSDPDVDPFVQLPAPFASDTLEVRELREAVDTCAEGLVTKRRALWDALLADPDASVASLAVLLGHARDEESMDARGRDAVYQLRREVRAQMADCIARAASERGARPRRVS